MQRAKPTARDCIPAPPARLSDPGLAFPIFWNGSRDQLRAGADLKAALTGHPDAFSPDQLDTGALGCVEDLATILGGKSKEADGTLPASILRQRGYATAAATGTATPGRPAGTPGSW